MNQTTLIIFKNEHRHVIKCDDHPESKLALSDALVNMVKSHDLSFELRDAEAIAKEMDVELPKHIRHGLVERTREREDCCIALAEAVQDYDDRQLQDLARVALRELAARRNSPVLIYTSADTAVLMACRAGGYHGEMKALVKRSAEAFDAYHEELGG